MGKKSLFFMVILGVLGFSRLAAASVSVMVIEVGIPKDSAASQYTQMWENGLMDVLFDSGHIVSNAKILRLHEMPEDGFPDVAERDFDEAKETGMQYFLITIVEHPRPYKVYLRLFSVKNQELIQELKYTWDNPRNDKEENENIRKAAGGILSRLR